MNDLRVRTVSKRTCEIAHVKFNFKLGLKCQTTVIFEKKNQRWKLYAKYSKHHYLFPTQNLFQNGANVISEKVNIISSFFVKQIQISGSSSHSILFQFYQLVVEIASKELQIVFWTFTVSNSNGNMKKLERKILCKKIDFLIGYFVLPLQMLTSKV